MDPSYGVCRLTLDYHRSFKYISAVDIKSYIDTYGKEPRVFLIDCPRYEESFFLHEIYSVLEELSNGRVEGSFSGRRLKFRIRRNIPIIVMTNSPPVLRSLSSDRWNIKAIVPVVSENDFIIQNAEIDTLIVDATHNLVTWSNVVQTLPISDSNCESELDYMLLNMYSSYCSLIKKQNELSTDFAFSSSLTTFPLGCLKLITSNQTMEICRAPEYVKRQYQLFSQKKI